jgi:cell division protein FtsI/penicillin-binding protein 2
LLPGGQLTEGAVTGGPEPVSSGTGRALMPVAPARPRTPGPRAARHEAVPRGRGPGAANSGAGKPRAGKPAGGKSGAGRPAANRRARRSRIAAAAVVVVGVLVIGFATGFGVGQSPEPVAQAFLLDWQQQQYNAAAELTTAAPATVATTLEGAFSQLYAAQMFLTMTRVAQHGDTARATFTATIDLAEQSRVWTYASSFGLREVDGGWKVEWSPRVVNPSLGPGDRLAVTTKFPARAAVLDSEGTPLQLPSPVYVVGVWPDRLTSPAATARAFAQLANLQPAQVLGQIAAAPPGKFFRLATLDPTTYAGLRRGLAKVPGLLVRRSRQRLYDTEASGLVGEVGSEINPVLRADGSLYLPGTTVGLTGLEQAYQRELVGTPTTEVVVVNAAGQQKAVLARWPGAPGAPVRTTINSGLQSAALTALGAAPAPGEIVAVQASTGRVLAVAQRQGAGTLPGPLDAQLTPGTAFTIVSAAALLASGLKVATPIPCASSFTVGGQTFTSDGAGAEKPFSDVFADGCGTAFAGLSERLSSAQLAQVARGLGIGASWSLPVPAFSGSVPSRAGDAAVAAETIGQGSVRMSLLSMAMVAAAIDSGRLQAPQVVENAPDPPSTPVSALSQDDLSALRGLLRNAVADGAARAAALPGAPVYGQVGTVHIGSTWTSWFVGYRGAVAVAAIETGKTARLSAAALVRAFLSAAGR